MDQSREAVVLGQRIVRGSEKPGKKEKPRERGRGDGSG